MSAIRSSEERRVCRLLVLAVLVVLSATATVSRAATVRVPSEYPTINQAMDAAAAGDTVLVAPGTYTDQETRIIGGFTRNACVFVKDGVTLLSEQGPAATMIEMLEVATLSVVVFGRVFPSGFTIQGFTLRAPAGVLGTNLYDGGQVIVRNCRFEEFDRTSPDGTILAVKLDLDVIDCVFVDCRAGGGGGAISFGYGNLLVSGSEFVRCTTPIGGEGSETATFGAVIEECEFVDNEGATRTSQAAVSVGNYSLGVEIRSCLFQGNQGELRGALGVGNSGSGPVTIEDCVFSNNRVTHAGNGVGAAVIVSSTSNPMTVIRRNTFHGNSAGALDGALITLGLGVNVVANNVISETASIGKAIRVHSGSISSTCNVFWQNSGGNTTYPLHATDREVDPLFCEPENGDFQLSLLSPCLPANSLGCGLIGALGQGCGVIAVQGESWGSIKSSYR